MSIELAPGGGTSMSRLRGEDAAGTGLFRLLSCSSKGMRTSRACNLALNLASSESTPKLKGEVHGPRGPGSSSGMSTLVHHACKVKQNFRHSSHKLSQFLSKLVDVRSCLFAGNVQHVITAQAG